MGVSFPMRLSTRGFPPVRVRNGGERALEESPGVTQLNLRGWLWRWVGTFCPGSEGNPQLDLDGSENMLPVSRVRERERERESLALDSKVAAKVIFLDL